MKLLQEVDFIKILENPLAKQLKENNDLDSKQLEIFEKHIQSLSINTDRKLVSWINPLLFHVNLNKAIEALYDYENLRQQELDINSYKILKNQSAAYLEVNKRKLSQSEFEYFDELNQIIKGDNTQELIELLNLRKTKKYIDLHQYYKASIYGAIDLFNFNKDFLIKNLKGSAKIREDLRVLTEFNKEKDILKEEIILPISLKASKYKDGEYFMDIKYLKGQNRNSWDTKIPGGLIEFDLSNHPILKKIGRHRLMRVGFEIHDDFTYEQPKHHMQRYWDMELVYNRGKDYELEGNFGVKHRVMNTFMTNVISSEKDGTTTWANNLSLINIPIDKIWELKVNKFNPANHNGSIHDIVMKFHLAYQAN